MTLGARLRRQLQSSEWHDRARPPPVPTLFDALSAITFALGFAVLIHVGWFARAVWCVETSRCNAPPAIMPAQFDATRDRYPIGELIATPATRGH